MNCYQIRNIRHIAMVCVGIAIVFCLVFIGGICAISVLQDILGWVAITGIALLALMVMLIWCELKFMAYQRRMRLRVWPSTINIVV